MLRHHHWSCHIHSEHRYFLQALWEGKIKHKSNRKQHPEAEWMFWRCWWVMMMLLLKTKKRFKCSFEHLALNLTVSNLNKFFMSYQVCMQKWWGFRRVKHRNFLRNDCTHICILHERTGGKWLWAILNPIYSSHLLFPFITTLSILTLWDAQSTFHPEKFLVCSPLLQADKGVTQKQRKLTVVTHQKQDYASGGGVSMAKRGGRGQRILQSLDCWQRRH